MRWGVQEPARANDQPLSQHPILSFDPRFLGNTKSLTKPSARPLPKTPGLGPASPSHCGSSTALGGVWRGQSCHTPHLGGGDSDPPVGGSLPAPPALAHTQPTAGRAGKKTLEGPYERAQVLRRLGAPSPGHYPSCPITWDVRCPRVPISWAPDSPAPPSAPGATPTKRWWPIQGLLPEELPSFPPQAPHTCPALHLPPLPGF